MAKGVVFSRDDAGRIAKVVRRVEGEPAGSGPAGWWPYVADDGGIRRGSFTAPWNKGSTVTVRDSADATITYQVKNYFANVAGTGGKSCAIARVGEEWILIAAEC
jgi:hypothetical protein